MRGRRTAVRSFPGIPPVPAKLDGLTNIPLVTEVWWPQPAH